jgi:hypothetical protein
MFDYFLKRKKQESENFNKISITYLIDNEDVPMIDVLLNSYDEDSVEALCSLLDILANDSFYVETVKMISENLAANGREDLLIKILTHVSNQKDNKVTKFVDNDRESQVYIDPTDAIM